MAKKRFTINNDMNLDDKIETYELSCIVDNENKSFYFIVDSIANVESFVERLNAIVEENKELERQCYLIHMSSMFSTVKSFKGDVSKRYKYSEETDTIYDTANHYGQYHKILDKKEITMLLNEYETIIHQ